MRWRGEGGGAEILNVVTGRGRDRYEEEEVGKKCVRRGKSYIHTTATAVDEI